MEKFWESLGLYCIDKDELQRVAAIPMDYKDVFERLEQQPGRTVAHSRDEVGEIWRLLSITPVYQGLETVADAWAVFAAVPDNADLIAEVELEKHCRCLGLCCMDSAFLEGARTGAWDDLVSIDLGDDEKQLATRFLNHPIGNGQWVSSILGDVIEYYGWDRTGCRSGATYDPDYVHSKLLPGQTADGAAESGSGGGQAEGAGA